MRGFIFFVVQYLVNMFFLFLIKMYVSCLLLLHLVRIFPFLVLFNLFPTYMVGHYLLFMYHLILILLIVFFLLLHSLLVICLCCLYICQHMRLYMCQSLHIFQHILAFVLVFMLAYAPTFVSLSAFVPFVIVGNNHPMQTCAKSEIHNPKLFVSSIILQEPHSFKEAYHFQEKCDVKYNALF